MSSQLGALCTAIRDTFASSLSNHHGGGNVPKHSSVSEVRGLQDDSKNCRVFFWVGSRAQKMSQTRCVVVRRDDGRKLDTTRVLLAEAGRRKPLET